MRKIGLVAGAVILAGCFGGDQGIKASDEKTSVDKTSSVLQGKLLKNSSALYGSERKDKSKSGKLHEIFQSYYDEYLELNPIDATYRGDSRFNHILGNTLSEKYRKESYQLVRSTLERLREIPRDELSEEDKLNFDIFLYSRQYELEGYVNDSVRKASLVPMRQIFSFPNMLAIFGSGGSAQPFKTVEDYERWLQRLSQFPDWVDSAIANMQQGMKEQIVLPRIIVERTLPQLKAHVVSEIEKSIFYKPIESFPTNFSDADRQNLTRQFTAAIQKHVVPSYSRLHDFMAEEYKPRDSFGLVGVPAGFAWYQHAVKGYTTTDLSIDEIHRLGLKEVAYYQQEMEKVKQALGGGGELSDFLAQVRDDPRYYFSSRKEIVGAYEAVRAKVDPQLDRLFRVKPKTDYVIKPVEAFREKSSPMASYNRPAADGSRPGVFYINTGEPQTRARYLVEALSVHEAAPGHHFQIALSQEQGGLPAFRRYGGFTAYIEGWGLYSEVLGGELGLYTDPLQKLGELTLGMWRACRLVVDTGIHGMGWSRDKAIAWMMQNLPMPEQEIAVEVERYMALPGQALSYKVGQLKISQLRAYAESELGGEFDIRAFHDQVLLGGAVPLDILEARIQGWVARLKSAS